MEEKKEVRYQFVFTPEPLAETDEHWVEVNERSEMMCDACKNFVYGDTRMDSNTENRMNCLEQLDQAGVYGSHIVGMDEFSQDARVAARLVNIYNSCIDWREIQAEKDLKGFLIAATLAMFSGYQTSNDVLKQVCLGAALGTNITMENHLFQRVNQL